MNLRDYEQGKFDIADILRRAGNLLDPDNEVSRTMIRDLFARLAEDRFNIVVVGRLNRGKTSVMNALLGIDRLPVGIVPLTSVVTTVSYGTAEKVFLKFEGSRLRSEIPLSALAEHITQSGNPGNVRGIRIADVRLRAELLRRGFFLVDTPGIGSAIAANTKTTEEFLPEADAFLLITSYEAALTEEEVGFLRREASSSRRIFVVLNKHDTVSAEHRTAVLEYVREQVQTIFHGDCIPIFSVSASEAQQARDTRNLARLSESGIPALEDELVTFVVTEKRKQILQQMSRRAADFTEKLPTTSVARTLVAEAKTLAASFQTPESSATSAKAIPFDAKQDAPGLAQLSTCEICREVDEALWKFECQFQYDISAEPEAKSQFAVAGGLCSFHTWQYHTVTSAYGICNAYPPLLGHLASKLRAAANNHGRIGEHYPILSAQCAACSARDAAEAKAILRLAQRFGSEDTVFDELSAICIPHLQKLVPELQNPEQRQRFLIQQASLIERVSEDMHRFALKVDATRRFLESKEEASAAERGLLLVAGHRNVSADAAPANGGARSPKPKS